MSGIDYTNAVAGALAGAAVTAGIAFAHRSFLNLRDRRRVRAFHSPHTSSSVSSWIAWSYASWLKSDPSFVVRNGFISRSDWNLTGQHAIAPQIKIHVSSDKVDFPVNKGVIEARKRMGQKLYDNETFFCDRIWHENGDWNILIKKVRYFSIVSNVESIEGSYRSYLWPEWLTLRHRKSGSPESFLSIDFKPKLVGCSVVPVFIGEDGSSKVLLHERSATTFTFSGSLAGLPNFGLVPRPSLVGNQNSGTTESYEFWNDDDYTLLGFNFFKEYLEELRGRDDLEDHQPLLLVEENSILQSEHVLKFRENLAAGVYKLNFLGFGFDTQTLGAVFRYSWCIYGNDERAEFFRELKGNWEMANNGVYPTLHLLDIESSELKDHLSQGRIHSAAAVTISDLIAGVGI